MKRKPNSKTPLLSEITIDKGIPLPPHPTHKLGGVVINAMRSMNVGQSFFYPNGNTSTASNMHGRAKKPGITVSVRAVIEQGKEGIRVWRTA